ncbi:MAG: cell surface protein SprA [Gemmatimonadota bacterium]
MNGLLRSGIRVRRLLVMGLLGLVGPLGWTAPTSAVGQEVPAPPDSVAELAPLEAEVVAHRRDGLRIGIGHIDYIIRVDLRSALLAAHLDDRAPGEPVFEWLADRWAVEEERRAARSDTLRTLFMPMEKLPDDFDVRRFFAETGAPADSVADADRRAAGQQIDLLPDALAGVADLLIDIGGTGQIGSQWESFDPCTLGQGQRCDPSAIPTIRPDFQLQATVQGTISERVFVDVDFDQSREFDATNNLNVWYEGLPGEILEEAEVGEVSLTLPTSTFISRSIPAGNFGLRAQGRLGPLTVEGVLAEQDGAVETRNLTLDVGGGEESVLQDYETVIDDANYASGQFFFVVDPREMPDYPHIDVTALQASDAPMSLQPASSLKLYRHEVGGGQQNIEEGVIQARAVADRPASADPALPDSAAFQGYFRPLVEGEDYIVHRSGLWVVLRSRTLDGEALAVSYITAAGDTVGDYDAEEIFREITNTGTGDLPRLELLRDPATHRPDGVTWEREMHQVYRISSSDDLELGSVSLAISQGPIESGPIIRQLDGEDFTFLQIFGLDEEPTDDRVDAGRIWQPSASGGDDVVSGSYLVFPTIEPFKNPPPISDLGDTAFPLNEGDLNRDIYDEVIDQLRSSSFVYRLNFEYRARSTGRESDFSLGAIGIRQGSERVTLDGRTLERGLDYNIDYEIGQLEILRPTELFGGSTNPNLEVRFEQKPIFQVQPTSIVGLTGEYRFGEAGSIDFIGLLQREGSLLNRPELGLEPGAVSLGGVMADFAFEPAALDRFVNSLPGISTDVRSSVAFEAELAGSAPTTNRQGLTYVEDFEGSSRLRVGLQSGAWQRGSVVTRPDVDGAGFLPDEPDLSNQIDVVWQSQWLASSGQVQGPLLTSEVDPAINTLNPQSTETVLWVSLNDTPADDNGWVTLTQPLSETGLDLTATEFLEFYALSLNSTSEDIALIIDIGTVSEDALVADSLGLPAGVGVLDQEADPLVGVWGNQDDTGLWGQDCVGEPDVTAYPLNDSRANCTNNNGIEDTEDLDRDNFLNQDERYFRYVVPLNVPSRYLDRQTSGNFPFSKFRVPLALPDHLEGVTAGARQNIKHIRITFASGRDETILLSRMEFSGSPWLKRAGSGSVDGFIGQLPGTAGTVAVGPISTVDGGYVSPPGISDQQAESTDDLTASVQPINEQSLRLTFEDVPAGERVEVFRRFTQQPRNFLLYRQFRAWALPIEGEFGADGPLRFYMRLGFDPQNFYLYRTPLQDAAGDAPARADWAPERFADLDRWIELRAEAERQLIEAGPSLPPDSSIVVWDVDVFPDADSTHAVVISDRSRAPNLAAIRELAMGVENIGEATAGPGEVWIDDLRLGDATDEGGAAMRAGVEVALADVATFETSVMRRNPFFRELGSDPTYESRNTFSTRAHVEVGRFLPSSLGIRMPVDVRHGSDATDPFFVQSSDVLAEQIPGLRTPSNSSTELTVGLSKQEESGSPILRATVDGLRLNFSRRLNERSTTQSTTDESAWSASASWSRAVADASVRVLPGFLRDALGALPGFISNSSIIENLQDLRFRYTPRDLSLAASLDRGRVERRRFATSVSGADEAVDPTIDRRHTLAPRAGIQLQPFPSLVAGLDFRGVRDLVDPSFRLTEPSGVEILDAARGEFLGLPVGWEASRTVATNLSYQPEIASWFDPRLTMTTNYATNRSPSYVTTTAEGGDTTFVRDLRLERNLGLDVSVQPSDFLTMLGVAPTLSAEGLAAALRAAWDRIRPVRLSWTRAVSASYDRRDLDPAFTDQLVLAGFDRLRRLSGADTASSATNRRRFQVQSALDLPLNLAAEVDFSTARNSSFTQLTERSTEETEWPGVRLRWQRVPVPGFLDRGVQALSLNGQWRVRDRVERTTTGQDRGSETVDRSLGITVVFDNGFNLSYDLTNSLSERTDGSGFSRSNRNSHGVRGTGTVPPPGLLGFVRNPLRLSAEVVLNGNADCRDLGGGGFTGGPGQVDIDGCVDYVDQTQNTVELAADADFGEGYSAGVRFQWVRRSSGVGTRQTTNQYNFDLFGRFSFRGNTSEVPPPSSRYR